MQQECIEMKIIDVITGEKPSLSFEVFPPKTEDKYENVVAAAEKIATLHPDYMSVTYGAGGGTSEYTADIAQRLSRMGVNSMAHLTCVSSTKERVREELAGLRDRGIQNILALRGDLPADGTRSTDYRYAVELIRDIRAHGDFCLGGACYPEGHIEAPNRKEDLKHLKEKVDAGLDFITTQMFFNNEVFYNFLYRAREAGITVPVIAGIMPITSPRQLQRSAALSGTDVPRRFRAIVDYFGDNPAAMKQAGIVYAAEQIIDLLANGIRHIHIYTMNKPDVAEGILRICPREALQSVHT